MSEPDGVGGGEEGECVRELAQRAADAVVFFVVAGVGDCVAPAYGRGAVVGVGFVLLGLVKFFGGGRCERCGRFFTVVKSTLRRSFCSWNLSLRTLCLLDGCAT